MKIKLCILTCMLTPLFSYCEDYNIFFSLASEEYLVGIVFKNDKSGFEMLVDGKPLDVEGSEDFCRNLIDIGLSSFTDGPTMGWTGGQLKGWHGSMGSKFFAHRISDNSEDKAKYIYNLVVNFYENRIRDEGMVKTEAESPR